MHCSLELLQVVALLSEVVAIGLKPQTDEQEGRALAMQGGACVAKAAWGPVAESIVSLESSSHSNVAAFWLPAPA